MHTQWNTTKMGFLSLATLLGTVAFCQIAQARSDSTILTNIPLLQLTVHQGSGVTTGVVDGPFNVYCPLSGGCRLVIEAFGQVGNWTGFAADWAMCFRVDGVGGFSCAVQGPIRTDGGWTLGNIHDYFSIPVGNHSVQMEVDGPSGVEVSRWHAMFYLYQ